MLRPLLVRLSSVIAILALGTGIWSCAPTTTQMAVAPASVPAGVTGPVTGNPRRNATSVATGYSHTCALLNGGTVQCWGANLVGELGINTSDDNGNPSSDNNPSCAIVTRDGLSVPCSGFFHGRPVGNSTNRMISSPVPLTVFGITGVVAVIAGGAYSCALLSSGTVQCWGYNQYGELGNGSTVDSSVPVKVSGITGAVALTGGWKHVCALLAGGTVQCWGYNQYGELGNGSTADSAVPMKVSGITSAISVVAGSGHTCALLADGTVQCWGQYVAFHHSLTSYGRLDNGTAASGTTCALLTGGTVECWGGRAAFDLDKGVTTGSLAPVTVSGIANATAVAAGNGHTCALLTGGTVRCWGYNEFGQLGNGAATSSLVPVTVSGITNATAVAAGNGHTCAVLTGGTVQCWGCNDYGQLGNGAKTMTVDDSLIWGSCDGDKCRRSAWIHETHEYSSAPVIVSGITNATAVAAGNGHTCAVLMEGAVQCWGNGESGKLGYGGNEHRPLPIKVSGF
jgi:alpha-tubulin suppressor-like RCC1 family protein